MSNFKRFIKQMKKMQEEHELEVFLYSLQNQNNFQKTCQSVENDSCNGEVKDFDQICKEDRTFKKDTYMQEADAIEELKKEMEESRMLFDKYFKECNKQLIRHDKKISELSYRLKEARDAKRYFEDTEDTVEDMFYKIENLQKKVKHLESIVRNQVQFLGVGKLDLKHTDKIWKEQAKKRHKVEKKSVVNLIETTLEHRGNKEIYVPAEEPEVRPCWERKK